MHRKKVTVTHETSLEVSMADVAQRLFGDQYDPNAELSVKFLVQAPGGVPQLVPCSPPPLVFYVTQFVRREQPEVPVKPGPAIDPERNFNDRWCSK